MFLFIFNSTIVFLFCFFVRYIQVHHENTYHLDPPVKFRLDLVQPILDKVLTANLHGTYTVLFKPFGRFLFICVCMRNCRIKSITTWYYKQCKYVFLDPVVFSQTFEQSCLTVNKLIPFSICFGVDKFIAAWVKTLLGFFNFALLVAICGTFHGLFTRRLSEQGAPVLIVRGCICFHKNRILGWICQEWYMWSWFTKAHVK